MTERIGADIAVVAQLVDDPPQVVVAIAGQHEPLVGVEARCTAAPG